jgi:hypothetical protein
MSTIVLFVVFLGKGHFVITRIKVYDNITIYFNEICSGILIGLNRLETVFSPEV